MEREIRRAAIVRHPHLDCRAFSEAVEKALAERGVTSGVLDVILTEDGSYLRSSESLGNFDLAISLGGDGTLLATARFFYGYAIPVFAVNTGTFGFLAAISHDEIFSALGALFAGQAQFEERLMLTCLVRRSGQVVREFLALNEIALTRQGVTGMISLDVWVNGEFLCRYRADGLIVATPTGSTGYSLSASGPILMPTLDNMIINPICPHSLASRPFVVAGGDVITISVGDPRLEPSVAARDTDVHVSYPRLEPSVAARDADVHVSYPRLEPSANAPKSSARFIAKQDGETGVNLRHTHFFLAADAQEGMVLEDKDEIEFRRAPHPLILVRSSERSYLGVLRTKLAWNGTPSAHEVK
ncbi:MAG: NAD(+)/NADH kinase [Spirochaetota bacterium]|jgi:NAD kinase|nr:NAD(+)/NADH kinase [Spirochaetota bacterium]